MRSFYKTYLYLHSKNSPIKLFDEDNPPIVCQSKRNQAFCGLQIKVYLVHSLEKKPYKIRIKGICQIAKDAKNTLEKIRRRFGLGLR